jgi:hypothetical protein
MENLRELKTKSRRNRSDVVRVSFSSTYQYVGTEDKNLRCHIAIGSEIIDLLQWRPKNYIHVFESDDGALVLKKNHVTGKGRYKLQNIKLSFSCLVSIPFSENVEDRRIRTVKHEVIEMEDGQKCLKVFMGDAK